MPWLLANAGYDPAAAVTFMTRWGSRHDAGILMIRDHDGWDERAEFIAAELPLVADLVAREGRADWTAHFRREIDPAKGLGGKGSRWTLAPGRGGPAAIQANCGAGADKIG